MFNSILQIGKRCSGCCNHRSYTGYDYWTSLYVFVSRPSILLAMLPVQEHVAKTIQYELDPYERLPELAAALNHYLSNVLKCISLTNIDVKTRVAVAIRHLSCFQRALCDSETTVPDGIKLYVSSSAVIIATCTFELLTPSCNLGDWFHVFNYDPTWTMASWRSNSGELGSMHIKFNLLSRCCNLSTIHRASQTNQTTKVMPSCYWKRVICQYLWNYNTRGEDYQEWTFISHQTESKTLKLFKSVICFVTKKWIKTITVGFQHHIFRHRQF